VDGANDIHGDGKPGCPEGDSKGGVPVATRSHEEARTKAKTAGSKRRKTEPEINLEEEEILKRAQIYLLFEARRPMLWTVAGIREERGDDGSRRWIIAVNLRYPTGFEGYLGDLLFDGTRFSERTDLELMRERAIQIAADPERDRKWNELRASAVPSGEG
jgi:hypothetical protein